MMPVRINANGKARTVEELQAQKKSMHLASFRYLLAKTSRDLERIAEEEGAQDRLARDPLKEDSLKEWLESGGHEEWLQPGMLDGAQVMFTVPGLLARIGQQCAEVLKRHEAEPTEKYNDEGAFRYLVAEMLETRAAAIATLRGYIEDPGAQMQAVMRQTITTMHRAYLSFLERTLPAEGKARTRAAERLCQAMGRMQKSVEEVDAEGLTPLMRAAADGAGRRVLRCLVAAGADVNLRETVTGRTALWLAACFGHAEAVEELARLGGDVNAAVDSTAFDNTPMWIAAQEGHTAVIEVLGRLGADVNRAADGRTPVHTAIAMGHTTAIEALSKLGADVRQAHDLILVQGAQSGHAHRARKLGAEQGRQAQVRGA
jgi:hypothetical protein